METHSQPHPGVDQAEECLVSNQLSNKNLVGRGSHAINASGTLITRHGYVGRSPFMIVPEFPVSDGGHTIASTTASQHPPLIQHLVGAPGSLAVDKEKQPVLVDIHRGSVVTPPSRVVATKILRPLLDDRCRGI